MVLPLVFGGQLTSALVTRLGNLLLLGVIWLVVGFGVFSILRWIAARFVQLLGRVAHVAGPRAPAPAVLLARDVLHQRVLAAVRRGEQRDLLRRRAGLFALITAIFPIVRLPGSVRELERGSSLAVPLRRRQRVNVGLVIFLAQGLQIVFVGVAIWVFFMVFGALLVTPAIRVSWIGTEGHVLFTLPFFGEQLQITKQLVRTAAGVASFSALYYAVASAVDSTYRDEFIERLTQQLQETFRERGEYLELLADAGPGRPGGLGPVGRLGRLGSARIGSPRADAA